MNFISNDSAQRWQAKTRRGEGEWRTREKKELKKIKQSDEEERRKEIEILVTEPFSPTINTMEQNRIE